MDDDLLTWFYEHLEWMIACAEDWREADDGDDDERRYQTLSCMCCAVEELHEVAAALMARLQAKHGWTETDIDRINHARPPSR